MTQKKSTTELEKTGEIDEVWDTLLRHLGEKFGVEYIPLPSQELGYADSAPMIGE